MFVHGSNQESTDIKQTHDFRNLRKKTTITLLLHHILRQQKNMIIQAEIL